MADALDAQNANLDAYQQYVRAVLTERGFDDETVSQKFMLLIEEVGELAKAARKHANIKVANDATNINVADEVADVFTVLLDICNQLGIDLDKAFIQKEQKNQTRTWE